MNKKQVILTITGPSCSGKTTLQQKFENIGFHRTMGFTTRQPREGEVHGKDYNFTTKEWVDSQPKEDIIERVEFNGNYYGVTRAEFKRQEDLGNSIIAILEPHGLRQYHAMFKNDPTKRFISVYLGGKKEVIYERFLGRLIGDAGKLYISPRSSGFFLKPPLYSEAIGERKKLLASYTSRLLSLEQELNTWYSSNLDLYEMVFPEFNKENEEYVFRDILRHIGNDQDRSGEQHGGRL